MRKSKILLADDHLVVAEALLSYLCKTFEIVGIVSDGRQLVESAIRHKPDVIVSDMGMPVMSGLLAMKQLRAQGIRSKVIFLTMHADPSLAWEAMQAGAEGYVLKDSAGEELVMAITQVLRGNIYLSSRIAHQVMVCRNTSDESTQRITPRQRDVLQLIVAGRTMKEVGAILDLSPRTIETHKYSMMQVLGCRTTAELMQYALRHKLVDSSLTC